MGTEDGKLVATAFRAVKQCHEDTGKLLRELDEDRKKKEWKRLWEGRDAITYEVSKSIYASHWMPEKVYRFYKRTDAPKDVQGVNVWYFGSHPCVAEEPLIVAGHLRYLVPVGKTVATVASAWDMIVAFSEWCKATSKDHGTPLSCPMNGRVEGGVVIGTPLYAVQKFDDVVELLRRCEDHLNGSPDSE